MNVALDRETDRGRFESERITLSTLRDGISGIYRDMGTFIVKTTEQMDTFSSMITPYVKYFYPAVDGVSADCFVSDVVKPSRQELDSAIDAAVNIMDGDEKMNESVAGAINEVLELGKSVDVILQLIDEIDVYRENMLIFSSKFGVAGASLARISGEVGSMAQLVNGIGAKFRDFMESLDGYRGEFNQIRRRIEVISENYLTRMKLNLSHVFGEMVLELGCVSETVNEMLAGSEEAERAMKVFVTNIQMEDIIRQKIEKIILLLDNAWDDNGGEMPMGREISVAAAHVAAGQIGEVRQHLSGQSEVLGEFCSRLTAILNGMLGRFLSGDAAAAENSQDRMDAIYRRIEDLKDEYVRHMEEIISSKKCLLGLCESFIIILNEFEGLFGGIAGTVRKFEAMNMITRIELARNPKFTRSLGGALTSIMSLPEQMKRIVDQSLAQYGTIRGNIVAAVEQYAENFKRQEEVLEGCIGSMKKVSVKLYESQKYYWDISQEVGRSSNKILGFIEGECRKGDLEAAVVSINAIQDEVSRHLAAVSGSAGPDLDDIRKRISEMPGNSRHSQLLATLAGELATDRTKEQFILF